MHIKVCGITRLEDALFCAETGVDYLGFNFYPASPRYISPEQCLNICTVLKITSINIKLVGVFVDETVDNIQKILKTCGLDLAQLSGNEATEDLLRLGNQAFKAVRPVDETDVGYLQAIPLRKGPPAFLVDGYRKGLYGGTGETADWRMASELALRYPIFLAGGLTSLNVREAIQHVRPWGVDTASGVESAPGVKDLRKIRAFVNAVRMED
ncbi:MAG: phosphoribosylanthranilate isomerase [Chloroflexi bacterium HGW-Chloroflexi-10]|nr:MAG: phosphoribosylanthranilate isomerase [Chloroflexi bacterium HGW-Chloroflexi-10]